MRINELQKMMSKRRLDAVALCDKFNIKALTGVEFDAAVLIVERAPKKPVLYTDFRYIPAARRLCPFLDVKEMSEFTAHKAGKVAYESKVSHRKYLDFKLRFYQAKFCEADEILNSLRAKKTDVEIEGVANAAKINDKVWAYSFPRFKPGMTERDMARVIKSAMIKYGDGEAFETIVCVGANAAECHHMPDDTLWNGREALLVDMGVKVNGFCSDMTRTIPPKRKSALYRRVYELVKRAQQAAVDALKPGMTGVEIDAVARNIITQGGFGDAFGHALGHGVGYEVHEAPIASKKSKCVFEPGMIVTIEPGIYLEGNLGVRIEDLVLVTEDGNKVLSKSPKM